MDWKKKLTSRKLWVAVASFVVLLLIAFGVTQTEASQIASIIMAGASVVAYIVGEGLVDSASAKNTVAEQIVEDTIAKIEEKTE